VKMDGDALTTKTFQLAATVESETVGGSQ